MVKNSKQQGYQRQRMTDFNRRRDAEKVIKDDAEDEARVDDADDLTPMASRMLGHDAFAVRGQSTDCMRGLGGHSGPAVPGGVALGEGPPPVAHRAADTVIRLELLGGDTLATTCKPDDPGAALHQARGRVSDVPRGDADGIGGIPCAQRDVRRGGGGAALLCHAWHSLRTPVKRESGEGEDE